MRSRYESSTAGQKLWTNQEMRQGKKKAEVRWFVFKVVNLEGERNKSERRKKNESGRCGKQKRAGVKIIKMNGKEDRRG